jgi:hypothetical protein
MELRSVYHLRYLGCIPMHTNKHEKPGKSAEGSGQVRALLNLHYLVRCVCFNTCTQQDFRFQIHGRVVIDKRALLQVPVVSIGPTGCTAQAERCQPVRGVRTNTFLIG